MANKTPKENYKIYRYNIELVYEYKGKDIKFRHEQISLATSSRDYVHENRPQTFFAMSVDKNVLDDMILNRNKKHIRFTLEKIAIDPEDINKPEKIKKLPRVRVYQDNFMYIIQSSGINTANEIDYGGDNQNRKDLWVDIMIGIMHPNTIKYNKINAKFGFFHNVTASDAILLRCRQIPNLILEPLDRNPRVNNTPTLTVISEFLELLYKKYKFYSTGYRLFYDYDYSYIVSNAGVHTKRKGELINSVILRIKDSAKAKSKFEGMITDSKKKLHIVDVDSINIEPLENNTVEKSVSNMVTWALRNDDNYYNHNNDMDIDMLYVTKSDLDTNDFTINKEYFIDNYHKLNHKRGRFILVSKKDLYVREGDFYRVNTTLIFKFVGTK